MVKVFYNGIDAFSGISPTPFVGVSDQFITYGQRWGATQTISLAGMITGACSDSYNDLTTKQSGLLSRFSSDFKQLLITDTDAIGNQNIFSGDFVKIDNVSFDQSPYTRAVNYKIDILVYPQDLFSGTFGVLDPVSEIKFNEQPDGTVSITRTCSAKGFNTLRSSSNALQNARSYVKSITGSAPIIPAFISGLSSQLSQGTLCPRKIAETVNRMDSIYSVNIDYILRKNASTNSVLQYTVDANYDEERGNYDVSLKGSILGGECKSMSTLRSELLTIDMFALAFDRFKKITNYTYLNPVSESFTSDENDQDNRIDFNYTYTSDPQIVKFSNSVDISNEYITDQVSVNFNGTWTARGPQSLRLGLAEAELAKFNPLPLCQAEYINNVSSPSLPMNPIFKSRKINRDLVAGSITLQQSFDNSQIPPEGFRSFVWKVSINPSLSKYNPIQFLDGNNGYFDLNYFGRGKVNINGSAVISDSSDFTEVVRREVINILNKYAGQFSNRLRVEDRVERQLKTEDNGYIYNFNISDTCETPIFSIQ